MSEPALKLDEWFTASDLRSWFSKRSRSFQCAPIVFINACEGGQMRSLFYRSFADPLLRQGAHAIIGPQIAVPACFAAEFAQRFFRQFFAGSRRVGEILRDLTIELADRHHNPLGLVYSLYYGLDTHLTSAIT